MPSTDTVRTALEAVAALLAPGHPAVAADVRLAVDDPDGYVRTYADRLDERGIDEPFPHLPWIALVDALEARRLLAEFDWKEAPDEIQARLRRLDSRPVIDPWDDLPDVPADELGLQTHEFLAACGRRYHEYGKALAVLDIESDCYPVVCLPASRAAELTALATRAGFAAHPLGPTPA
ncbi:hypothetical protein [Streptomyces sp. CBMA29]|uniref:DUF6630 family protein n=1 Tax=Streptomyces sp. CBMA29 TaxID=1896314 RepID=UPI001661CDB3|nr:hypothetical protein [Streptomyces sp. CBMA29]MBD0737125.1 hypothetical protein [Streptomyces sp. CBMA29]